MSTKSTTDEKKFVVPATNKPAITVGNEQTKDESTEKQNMDTTTTADDAKFVSPVTIKSATIVVDKDQAEHEIAEKQAQAVAAAKKETPIAVRTRRYFNQELHLSSPSDSQLSPCTAKLFGKGGKKMMSGPTTILRSRQQNAMPSKFNDCNDCE
ncbi:hypothetical protein KIN20_016733 [Parelaphostrongylus tenuis]|uniref:Uncharacterized protein n=1 Tax=Parelaphostrongylus tenuis TaxID=148309 RepID=A0AAD5MYZ6_PARTN|nr:hypothetical protein KIN20_016733 [Parelaphostrongylus tenuis]